MTLFAASTAMALPAQAKPAAPAIEPVFSPRSGAKTWLFTSPPITRAPANAGVAGALSEPPSVPKGTGPVRNATQISFAISDRLEAKVNVGSGNLLLTTTELTLPGIAGNVTLGASFNSLLLGTSIASGALGPGWRTRSGVDVRLYPATSDNSVTYVAADGVVGKFTASGSGYRSPSEFKATLEHDGSGWKLTEHGSGRKLFFTSDGLLDKTQDRNDNVTDFQYSNGQLTKVVSDRGVADKVRVATVSYTDNKLSGYRQTGADNSTRQATYAYDSSGRLQNIKSTTPRNVSFEYSSAGDLTKITTAANTIVKITYDGQHRVTSVNQVTVNATDQGSVTRFAYPTSSQTLVADPRQDLSVAVPDVPHTTYELNDDKRVTKATDPAGNSRSKSYTPFADVASSVSPEGGTVTNSFGANAGESLTKSASPTGASASAAYANPATSTNPTANFQPSSSIDTQGNSSSHTYNGAGNRTSTKDALAAEAKVDYNDDGTVKKSTDPGNDSNGTTYAYDGNKQLVTMTPPTGNGLAVKNFSYDAFGRLRTTVVGGCTTTYGYDLEDRVTSTSYSGCTNTATVTYTYGQTGNLISRTDATGTTTYDYDQLRRLRTRTAPGAAPQTYVPDPAGNLERLTDGRGTTRYSYNTRNQLVRLDTAGGTRYNFSYDKNGNRTHEYFATDNENTSWALHTETRYDKSDRPTRITATRNSAALVKVFDMTYCYAKFVSGQGCSTSSSDDTGMRQWQKDEITGTVSEFSHDKGNRLTKATNYNGHTYEYAYDSAGNRTSVKVDGNTTQTLTYNSANQITTANNAYDNRGNQTRVSEPGLNQLDYNTANQLTTAPPDTFSYAGADQVEVTKAGSITLNYGLEDQYGMPWLQSWTNGTNSTAYVERDGTGTPLGLRIDTTDYAYVLDGLGSPVAIVGADSAVKATYKYDPYGTIQAGSNENALPQSNIIRYTGGTYNVTTKLTKLGQRWYNPNQGRFTQQDNLSFIGNPGNGNRYAYAGDNPVNNIDPTGQSIADLVGDIGWYKDLGEAGANFASGDTEGLEDQAKSIGVGLAVETGCNFVLGLAAPETAGASMVVGQLGCMALSAKASDAVSD